MLNRDWWGLSCLWELSKASKPKYSGETDKQQRNTRNFFLCKEKYFSSSNQNSITQFPCLSKYFSNSPKIHLVLIKMSTSPLFDIDSKRTWNKRWKPHSLSLSLYSPQIRSLWSDIFQQRAGCEVKQLVIRNTRIHKYWKHWPIIFSLSSDLCRILWSGIVQQRAAHWMSSTQTQENIQRV